MITKETHPYMPDLRYRYEYKPAGLIGYARTKKGAEKSLADTKRRYKEHFQINWSNFKRSNKT